MTAPSSPPSIMSGSMNWEPVRKRLLGTDLKDALAAACELREGIEIVHTVEFPLLLSALLPAFSNILAHRTKPNADPSSLDSKLRNTILEIICRMPSNETLRPHAPHLVAVALDILNRDYEENALLASRVIFDLYKVYRTLPQDYVQPYLDFVQNSYRTLPTSVQRNFLFHALAATAPSTSSIDGSMHNKASLEFNVLEEVSTTPAKAAAAVLSTNVPQSTPGAHPEQSSTSPKATTAATPPSSSSQMTSPNLGKLPSSPVARLSPRSNSSFRVLTECPLIVMLMFQLYPKFLRSNIPILINVMMEALALRAPTLSTITQAGELLDNAGQRLYFSRCRELVAAQAKTLSFLTYLLRGFSNDLKPYEDRLAANVVALMSTCPREFISTRKELLVATRHLLNSEFRNGFFRHVDSLLDERVLLGSHHRYSEQTILRPLGYTTLSDLVHHVRSLLNMNQMSRVVSMFARVLHDQSSLPLSTQYTAVRTLLSIVDIIFHNKERDPQIGRDILVRILKTLVDKLSALSALDTSTCSTESLRDFKSMIRAIVVGHKTLIWYINNYRSQREKQKIPLPMPSGDPTKVANEEVSSALLKITNTEHQLIDRYIVLAFPCMKCLQPLNNSDSSNSNNTPDPYRDALTYFAAAFTTLDGFDLRRTLGRRLNLLVEAIMDDPIAIVVPRHLLGANGTTSFEFCALLLDFLVERLDLLAISSGKEIQFLPVAKDAQVPELERLEKLARAKPETQEDQTKRSAAYLQLFERVLKSLSSFPDNERCLRPHLKGIVSFCLRSTMERSASCCFSGIVMDNHCMLLRYIFRSISAGKFEESYKELLPLIPTVLNGLWRVLQSTEDLTLGNIIIELLLTIPARLSSLLPHMNLLLRVITRALESTLGDLVNLGLRTLEFWVDNLNPEFLFPELTKQTRLFVQLMKALSHHLKPAPYPYGLLTLRLLGKLGGKNRRVLREPMEDSVSTTSSSQNTLSMDCAWALVEGYTGKQEDDVSSFALEIPISQCVQVLKQTATSSSILSTEMESTKKKSTEEEYTEENINLWEADLSTLDLYPYCKYAIQRTRKNQVQSAVTVLRSALTKLIDVHEADGTPSGKIEEKEEDQASPEEDTMDMQSLSWLLHQLNQELQLVGLGLFFAATEGNDHLEFAKGLLTHSLMIVFTHQDSLVRVDANGSAVVDTEGIPNLGSLKPFGYCKHTHVLKNKRDPMILNHSLAEYLTHNSVKSVGLTLLEHILSLVKENIENRGAMIYVEHLLCVLIETCVKSDWNQRLGLYEAIGVLQQTLGQKWALQYEQELVYIAMISLKSIPKEMSIASIQAFDFFTKVCCGLYGVPCSFEKDPEKLVVDILCSPPDFISASDTTDEKSDEKKSQPTEEEEKQGVTPCNSVLETIITEMASSKQLVRIAARYMLKHYFVDQLSSKEVLDKFTKHLTLVKRVLFSRSLRLLPLPEQIGVVEALSTIVQQIPDLFVLDDQHLLAFLSELLKMSSVADGEMADANLTGDVIDKNGLAVTTQSRQVASSTSKPIDPADMTTIPSPPASALFLRRDCLLTTHLISQEMKHRIIIPQELPLGVQLRVSTISLLRFVIRGHANPFFDAETSTPIGNIRPHVISLLFRSLVSRPIKAVTVAHDALRDVLSLSVVSTPSTAAPIDATTTESKSKSRLRKELLQTCIRPVLLNLRDYSRLSPHLLRGLSRLLSLLSSWFNKTLGEKLLDHLQKWTDPNRMKAQKIWKEGQEPDVAAAIVDLFVLLPHAAHFVEPLVKTTIKLEACLPAFKSRHVISPYRKPLARYLNKHCQYTVPFFFQRLKTPLYSELFQDIITFQEESVLLREYLSGRQCSVSLLNICFERPLAIIRSEKTPASPLKSPPKSPPGVLRNTTELLFLHGIEPGAIPPSPKEVGLRQDLEARNKRVILLQQEYKRAQEFLKKSVTASSPLEDTKRKHQLAKLAFERAAKEFKDSKQRYTSEMTKIKAAKKKSEMDAKSNMSASARPMNVEAMELQHQGFRLVETLIQNNDNYLKEHNDVLRAFRWLWRSKGRYLRLQYDQSVPPRYHGESKLLASFLVDYSKQFPNDVDLLFELIRIFLQSSASDFSFVKQFLAKAVPNLSQPQKKQILQRFFVLLAGESTEEIKTLSIQLVVFPMLESSFHDQNHEEFIDAAEIEKFVQEVLFHEGKVVVCGNRLKIELLRLSNLFLESVPRRHLEEHGKDLIKFCWTLLKSDDTACKSWAYLVVCRFASVLDTPSKLILQVYVALLRAHQQEGKDLVREALDLLVPALSKRLKDKDKKKMVEYTNRIMFEEGNSVPQLAHIWHVIVKHPAVFYQYRNQFVRYMINSLNRLGLPPNCPPENRVLSVSIVELVTQWDNESTTSSSSLEENFESSKRSVEETNDTGSILPQSAEKKQKTLSGSVDVFRKESTESLSLLDQSMVDTIVNFIIRSKILLADPKVESGGTNIEERLEKLLKTMTSRWQRCVIRPIYLEKVVTLCKDENALRATSPTINASKIEEKGRKQASKPKAAKATTTAGAKNDDKKVTSALLSACLDIFVGLAEMAPENSFLTENSYQLSEILISCFFQARQPEEHEVRKKLQQFVVKFLSCSKNKKIDTSVVQLINVQIESFLVDAEIGYRKGSTGSQGSSSDRQQNSTRYRQTALEQERSEVIAASFALGIINEISSSREAYFKTFTSSLLGLLETLVKKHISDASSKQKQGGVSNAPQVGTGSIRQIHHTPTVGILNETFLMNNPQSVSAGARSTQPKEPYPSMELNEFNQTLRSTALIIEMLGTSDLAYSFTRSRKALFQIMSNILDSSNSIQLLLTAVRVVGRWLLSDIAGGPLTSKERYNFLWRIASFDFNGLPDAVAQPLADLVSHYVIAFLSQRGLTIEDQRMPDIVSSMNEYAPSKNMPQIIKENDDAMLGRSMVSCLVTANHPLRDILLSLFVSQTNRPEEEKHSSAAQGGIPLRTPTEVLWQLFHSDFEGLGGRYWIVVFVELLLVNMRSSAHIAGSQEPANKKKTTRLLPMPRFSNSADSSPLLRAKSLSEYQSFVKTVVEEKKGIDSGGEHFVTALRQLAHGDVSICQSLFETLLPASWIVIPNDEIRLGLVLAMESLLSCTFHSQFFKNDVKRTDQRAMNSIRSFLNGLSALKPLPTIDINIMVSLAETYNCWYEVLSILEHQYLVVSNKKLSKAGIEFRDEVILAMQQCYRQLGESNIWMGLALKSCILPDTKRAASLDVYGKVDGALEAYSNLVDLVESGASSPPDVEIRLWEERWVDINREQCQLGAVAEYANASSNSLLMLECAWKMQDWDRVRALCSMPSLVAAVESGEPAVKMSETLLAVADGKLSDVENLHAQTAQLCLYKWQQLPALTSGSNAHAGLLHFFHRLVEIRESGQIMVETSNHSTGKTLPDLKNLLNAWRHRLPNDYEDLTMWDEVFTWRSHMFNAITSNFHWSEPSTLATLHDRPWTAIRMSMTARKQGMRQTALLLLNKLTDNRAMDVSDAYLKLREQILSYNNPENDLERTGGLNLINTTNLSFFDPAQKSELFRLKAIFLASLRRTSKSNQGYCHSIQICPTHSKSWVSWGGLCSSLGTLTERQTEQLAMKSGSTEKGKESRAASAKKVAQYLAQAMGCYLEAVQINAHEKSRIHLPKCLWMLTKDGSSPGVLCQTLENRGTKLPPWVWLPWIPQLLTGLSRIEGRAIKAILSRLVKAYPQAVYYSLRAFYLERRDVERAKGISSSSGQHMASVAYAEEMMSTLRRSHTSLWSSLEAILEELIVKFRPSYEEELLATISALLERAESHSEKQCLLSEKSRVEDEDAMVASWSKTLSRIAAKFFRTSDSSSGTNRRDERVRKTAAFKRKYKADFENDFKVDAEGPPEAAKNEAKALFSLDEYITKLQAWKIKLEAQVACTPSSLPLIESSQSLAMFCGDIPDLWPGACDTKYLNSNTDHHSSEDDQPGRNQTSTSSSAAIARRAAHSAAVAAAAAAAKEGVGGEYGGGSVCIEIPGRYCPNSSASTDIRPSPELHAKLIRFEPFVEVLRRNDQLVRRVGMLGSDGRSYKFLLQFAIPYWTRTDERTAQTHYVIDKFLRQNCTSARNHLSVQPSAAIPVAQRLRMTLDVDSRIALDDVLRKHLERKNQKVESIASSFLKQVAQGLKEKVTDEMAAEEKKQIEKVVRLSAYHQTCNSKIEGDILLRHIRCAFDGPEPFFHFRRAVTGQLAANSLLQYVFSVAERTPPRLVILQSNARVLSPDFRVSYSNQGFIEGLEVPFRMTPNIENLIGRPYLDGRFIKAIAMIASAIYEHRDEFDPILRILMRDDILAWYSKSLARSDSKTQELERQLIERVTKNVATLQSRISDCAPSRKTTGKDPIDVRVQDLCRAAADPDKLCMMPTNYHAWL